MCVYIYIYVRGKRKFYCDYTTTNGHQSYAVTSYVFVEVGAIDSQLVCMYDVCCDRGLNAIYVHNFVQCQIHSSGDSEVIERVFVRQVKLSTDCL